MRAAAAFRCVSMQVLALSLVGCSLNGRSEPSREAGNLVASASQVDGVTISVYDSGQPFSYLTSVIALSAFGDRVAVALDEIGYEKNRRLWDKGFKELMSTAEFDDLTLIALASVTAVEARSRGQFLTQEQVGAVGRYLDDILDGKLPLGGEDADLAPPSIATASMLRQISRNLAQDKLAVGALIERIAGELVDSTIDCTPRAWLSDERYILVERLMAGLDLGCTLPQLHAAWDAVMSMLDDGGDFGGPRREALAIVVLTSVAYADAFSEDEIARVQAAVDRSVDRPSVDAYDWIYEHKLFVDQSVAPYDLMVTPAADEILLYAASRGSVPYVEVER